MKEFYQIVKKTESKKITDYLSKIVRIQCKIVLSQCAR